MGTVSQGIVDFMIRVELTDPDSAVRPGMTAAVEIIVRQPAEALAPNQVLEDGKFSDRDGGRSES